MRLFFASNQGEISLSGELAALSFFTFPNWLPPFFITVMVLIFDPELGALAM